MTVLVVVVTADHFWLDAAAGAVLVVLVWPGPVGGVPAGPGKATGMSAAARSTTGGAAGPSPEPPTGVPSIRPELSPEVSVMVGAVPLPVGEVMTRNVVTVTPETGFRDAVALLVERRIGALPVLDGERLVGMVTRGDLLLKEEACDRPDPMAGPPWQRRRSRLRASATRVGGAMSRHPRTVPATASLSDAAHLMHQHAVGSLPVVDEGGRLIGMVTRSDLLRVFLRPDAELLADVESALGPLDGEVRCAVADGCVTLTGSVRYLSEAHRAAAAARHVPGVVDVRCSVVADVDDVHAAVLGP